MEQYGGTVEQWGAMRWNVWKSVVEQWNSMLEQYGTVSWNNEKKWNCGTMEQCEIVWWKSVEH